MVFCSILRTSVLGQVVALRASVSLLVNGSEESSGPIGRVSAEAHLLLVLDIVDNVAGLDDKGL